MKTIKKIYQITLAAFSIGILFASCNDSEPEVFPAPSVTLSPEAASNLPGTEVSTVAKIEAPAGIKSLSVLKNGTEHDSKSDFNATSAEYELKYVIEDLPNGTVVNFTFVVVDAQDRSSTIRTFAVTVSEVPPTPIVEIAAGNLATTTWTKDNIYRLNGYVRVQEGQVLTIEPGTLIIGDEQTKGTLIIQQGGKIMAEGTAEEPIVFTSEKAPGLRRPGDWGGVVICGKAINNRNRDDVELEGNYGAYHGGNDDDDNSGILKYARIEYAGIPINPNEEVNSLTMGSVGRGTVIENIMCSYGLDDAFEWFGGTVDGKYLIAYRGLDDDFDVDLGHSGTIQYGLSIRDSKAADQSGSNGFEVDNDGQGTDAQPYTSATFANITVIGPKKLRETSISSDFQHAMQLRRNSRIKVYNAVVTGYPHGIYIDGTGSQAHADADRLRLRNVVLAGVEGWGGNGFGSAVDASLDAASGLPFTDASGSVRGNHPGSEPRGHAFRANNAWDARAWFLKSEYGNKAVKAWNELGIDGSLFDLGTPKVTLTANSPLRADNAAELWDRVPAEDKSKFEQTSFIGAFGDEDWTEGWAAWDAATRDYGVSNR